ncbi:MAG TPA: S46 family peptidase [Gemmatimonadales bacterium]|nr:S46 family peptidase [Gemmatimonadales bacterium]
MRPTAASLRNTLWIVVAALAMVPSATARAQDSTRAGRFDLGKMWTFENPPTGYFSTTYGFRADTAWFTRARLAALRIPSCSAGLVSADGLIVTNHHCVRSRLASVARPGETLLDSGFVAPALTDERRIPDYYADQLIAAIDVTDQLEAPGSEGRVAGEGRLRSRLLALHGRPGDSTWVQFVELYDGARTSAYVFRRLTDIRFVMAVELQMGFFGGDPDNFTYPRYALDFAVLRAYGADGRPLPTPSHFAWGGGDGVREGDVVFVIGSPGRTARLTTIAELEYARDVGLPITAHFLRSRIEAMQAYLAAEPAEAERIDLRNRIFSLSNRLKSAGGRLEALHDPTVMARRGDSERILGDSLRARPELGARYGAVVDRLASLARERRTLATGAAAFSEFLNATGGSGTLQRAWWAWRLTRNPEDAAVYRGNFAQAPSWPAGLERRLLALQLGDIARAYGPDHAVTRALLNGATPEAAADRLMASSVLAAAPGTTDPAAVAGDPAVRLVAGFGAAMLAYQEAERDLSARESAVAADLGRARYAVFGDAVPPDGSLSPRIADGTVQGYRYNGTVAPPWTTFFGVYDRNRSFDNGTDWALPGRWRVPPAGLDLGTPLNFVSTADTYGGNSGSPAVTRDLRLVGLNFDRNINALVRDYLYLPERGRNIMVDARAIEAALGQVYGLERIVAELRRGRLDGGR